MSTALPPPPPSSAVNSNESTSTITEDEAALYDRQLRLWGVEAQNRMRNSSILLCGHFKGLAAEISKNIVLAGIGKVALVDGEVVEWSDLGSNYWAREEDVGKSRVESSAPRLQLLNPRVQISTHTDLNLVEDEEFMKTFDLIVVTDADADYVERVNTMTRRLNKKMFACSSLGIHGWAFADLLHHEFIVDQEKTISPGETLSIPTKLTHKYCSFVDALTKHDFKGKGQKKLRNKTKRKREVLWCTLALFEIQRTQSTIAKRQDSTTTTSTITVERLRKVADEVLPRMGVEKSDLSDEVIARFIPMIPHEFAPTCAILGGIVGQDVLNAVGGKEEPVKNLCVFDGELGEGGVWSLGC